MNGKKILVIDDSNTNLVLLESLLEKNGYEVFSALSAKEGLESMEDNQPDLIYLDLIMPGIDGMQFIKLMKQNDDWKEIPVVILSAISDSEVIQQGLNLGVADYITKPLNIHKIVSLTESLLSN